ncbi:hypothetical protein SAMN05660463_02008 [Pseudomonas sp. URIL14HWK12:I9]|nr:hypothetical protein F474_02584 [Pseudomonas sp. URIL14HWK12:I12]PVZ23809.1 hypothetical protein F470_02239 [Pseudomonas sp. URIL14HWK12:I10]PVZ33552.1 hypothetical protein F472_03023 [Pseudomonas sp. URIL14HWK12:I11]SNZ11998.1 hypothetical protein SAMN05660463_02008 [Pseudomonas sp. URIL14HWK12:I9]
MNLAATVVGTDFDFLSVIWELFYFSWSPCPERDYLQEAARCGFHGVNRSSPGFWRFHETFQMRTRTNS